MLRNSQHSFDIQMTYVYDLAVLDKVQSKAKDYSTEDSILYPRQSLVDDRVRKSPLERGLSWLARALVGEEIGSVVAVCFTHAEKLGTGEHGFSLNVATNRSATTDNPIDRKLYEEDKNASRALVTVLNTLFSQHTSSSSPLDLVHDHENELLHFLVKRSKGYVIKKAASICREAPGLGTILKTFSKSFPHGQDLVVDWVSSVATLDLHARSLLGERDPKKMIPRIGILSDQCAFLLATPLFRTLMRQRLYTLEKGTPDVFDEQTKAACKIPGHWDSKKIIRAAKFGRQLDRFSSFKTGFSNCQTFFF